MAHSLSAQKRARQNEKRKLLNKQIKSRVKTAMRSIRETIAKHQSEKSEAKSDLGPVYSSLRRVFKVLDKAAGSRIIHENKASRLKSRLTLAVNKLGKR
jgi:small subunit ribosomal protein S20